MLVSRGSSEGGGGFATKKVKINTRLTAAPAASITYNFRSPPNKWFSPLEMSFRVNTLLIEMTPTEERTVLSYFWERKFWINTRLTGIGWRHKAQLSAASTSPPDYAHPAHTQDYEQSDSISSGCYDSTILEWNTPNLIRYTIICASCVTSAKCTWQHVLHISNYKKHRIS